MTDKVWLIHAEVGTRFGTTRQRVWVQARTNPKFPQPLKLTARWSRWALQEIEAFEQDHSAASRRAALTCSQASSISVTSSACICCPRS